MHLLDTYIHANTYTYIYHRKKKHKYIQETLKCKVKLKSQSRFCFLITISRLLMYVPIEKISNFVAFNWFRFIMPQKV